MGSILRVFFGVGVGAAGVVVVGVVVEEAEGVGSIFISSSLLSTFSSTFSSYLNQSTSVLAPQRSREGSRRTVSIPSGFSASLAFLALAVAFAVVERTAVATFSTTSFVGGFVAGG